MATRILIILALFFLSIPLSGQSKSIKSFYKKYKRAENTININAPGWLIRLGVSIAANDMKGDPSGRAVLGLVKKIRRARILLMENKNQLREGDLQLFISDIRNEGFETVVETRESGAEVDVLVVQDKEYIKKMLVLVHEENSLSMIALKTKIHQDGLDRVLNDSELK